MSSESRPRRGGPGAHDRAGAKREGGARTGRTRPRERSAGGVVVHEREVLVIVPTRRAADGAAVLGLPKGHIDPGENALAAAIREVREEAGVEVELVRELGEVRYWYSRGGRAVPKAVEFFLFRYLSGDPADHDDEVQEARWMPLAQARTALTYEGEREMIERALAVVS